MPMTYSAAGLTMTKEFEGFRSYTYRDTGGVRTIGYGHTGPDVELGQTISEAAAEALLRRDMKHAVDTVNQYATVPLNQNQFDALCDFAFNVGCGAFERSTLLVRVNAGDMVGAREQFGVWINVDGQPNRGLQRRRAAEAALFAKED